MLLANNLHVLCLAETWLDANFNLSLIEIDNYYFIGNNRNIVSSNHSKYIQGGGVGFYIHKSFSSKILAKSENSDLNHTEFLIIELSSNSTNNRTRLLIAVVYRRPKGAFLNEFFFTLSKFVQSYKNIIITGDLNINFTVSSLECDHLKTILNDHSLFRVPLGPTHFTSNSNSTIDYIITDSQSKVLSYSLSTVPIAAGHHSLTIKYKIDTTVIHRNIRYRDWKNCNFNLANRYFEQLNEQIVLHVNNDCDPNSIVNLFNDNAQSILNTIPPFKTVSLKRPPAPWLTTDLKLLCKHRDKLYKKAKRLGSPQLLLEFRSLRREIKQKIQFARENFLRQNLLMLTDPISIWRFLGKAGLTSDKTQNATNYFNLNDLNSHFAAVSSQHPVCSQECFQKILELEVENPNIVFAFQKVTQSQVLNAFSTTLTKSHGNSPDNLPLKYLSRFFTRLLPSLTLIYNCIIDTGIYPDSWKQAFIVPLNKCSQPKTMNDTRPIANLSHLAKIFDKLITIQIRNCLESNNLLNRFQSGFRADHSTQTALLQVTDSIRYGIENGLITLLVLFDFSKAFDSVDHSALLIELRKLGFNNDALKLCYSYLKGRRQAVINEIGDKSAFLGTSSGVPQGSSPGPILFAAVINSINNYLKFCKFSYHLFADDLQLFVQCPPSFLNNAVAHINEDAKGIINWADVHGLKINALKTKAIVFGSDINLKWIRSKSWDNIIIDGEIIQFSDKIKNLGVYMTPDLRWNSHISHISSNIHKVLHKLRARAWLFPKDIKIMLVSSLVLPHLDYACLVYNDIPAYLNLKVQRLMNAVIRFIFNLKKDSEITVYRKELGWLTVENRRLLFLGALTYKILH